MPTAGRTLPKCDRCRKDKQKCLPVNRAWPDRCYRCISQNHVCSEAQSVTPHKRPLSISAKPTSHRLSELRQLAPGQSHVKDRCHGPNPECSQADAEAARKREAILLLSISEMISMAIEELVAIASEMITPFIHDTRYSDPRDSMPQVQLLVDELRAFSEALLLRALEFEAGPRVSFVQAAMGSKPFSKSTTWTGNQSVLQTALQKATSWDTADYPGLSHVLQTKLFRDQPHLLIDNTESFLLHRESFLAAASLLLDQLPMQVPSCLKSSQFFVPCAFTSIPMIAFRLSQRNTTDCIGRSVSHVLSNAKCLKTWPLSDIHAIDSLGRTSLYLACYGGNDDHVRQLVQANANPNMEAANGLYPLDIAVISGDLNICKIIWKMELGSRRMSSQNAARACVDNRYDTSLGFLRRSPMMWAAFFGHDHIVKFLRTYGGSYAHPSATALTDGNLCDAIGLAAIRGHKKVIEYLIASGHPCDMVDLCERSPLWHAASGGHLPVVQLLLRNHVLLDRQDTDGFTPLEIAAHRGHSEVADYLQKRADGSMSTDDAQGSYRYKASGEVREFGRALGLSDILAQNVAGFGL